MIGHTSSRLMPFPEDPIPKGTGDGNQHHCRNQDSESRASVIGSWVVVRGLYLIYWFYGSSRPFTATVLPRHCSFAAWLGALSGEGWDHGHC